MAWNNSTTSIRTQWQTQIETSLEAGGPPLLDLGANTGVLDSVPALAALHAFAAERVDLTAPTIVSSGNSLLWFAALLYPHNHRSSQSPNLQVVYGGADLATHMASIETQRTRMAADEQANQLPARLALFFAPGAQAGPLLWEALPFAVTEEADGDPWLAWVALVLAVGLVLMALLV